MKGLCSTNRAVTTVYRTKITQFLESLPYKNEITKFLILLSDNDFESACPMMPSLNYRIIHFNDFPGQLIIDRFSNIKNFDYKIEDSPQPKLLYILLPKEQLYINIKDYDSRILTSKMEEITNIFMYLGATEINSTKYYKTSKNENITIGGGVDINSVNVSSETSGENTTTNINETRETLSFPSQPDFKVFIPELYNYHYLPKTNEWQHIIKRRVDGLIKEYKYTFINTETKKLRRKLVNKLKYLNITVDYNHEEFLNIKKTFDVKFNDLIEQNISYGDFEFVSHNNSILRHVREETPMEEPDKQIIISSEDIEINGV